MIRILAAILLLTAIATSATGLLEYAHEHVHELAGEAPHDDESCQTCLVLHLPVLNLCHASPQVLFAARGPLVAHRPPQVADQASPNCLSCRGPPAVIVA